jgi:hypothetical protein
MGDHIYATGAARREVALNLDAIRPLQYGWEENGHNTSIAS